MENPSDKIIRRLNSLKCKEKFVYHLRLRGKDRVTLTLDEERIFEEARRLYKLRRIHLFQRVNFTDRNGFQETEYLAVGKGRSIFAA